jgi:hypothetical protein
MTAQLRIPRLRAVNRGVQVLPAGLSLRLVKPAEEQVRFDINKASFQLREHVMRVEEQAA